MTFGHVDRDLQDRYGPVVRQRAQARNAIDIMADAIQMFIEDDKPALDRSAQDLAGQDPQGLKEADPVYYETYFGTEGDINLRGRRYWRD